MTGILGVTPFERPDPGLAVALCRADALGAVDLGRDLDRGLAAVATACEDAPSGLGVRIHREAVPDPSELPDGVEFVILPAEVDLMDWQPWVRFVRATTIAEARKAAQAGAEAIILAGSEAGGRIGEFSSFIFLQHALREVDVPIWVQGGIGLHTAAACIAGGASGVVIDSQLARVRESTLETDVKDAIAAMDGSETAVVAGFRVFTRPDLTLVGELAGSDTETVSARLGADDLRENLIPVGQEGAFASDLADRFVTAGGVVQGIRQSILESRSQAEANRPLAPASPLAAAIGTDYPILQGPMTRVSDRPEFAEAVAAAGGLPFLALSLMRGESLTTLLEETGERLGDRPWGVGILGFVPPELRAEQLEAIEKVQPPFALIAGGRPSQARRLEARGIETFLHVPSTGLLDLFLKEGSRRFVFEGRECGGHVGPLSSFVLWERQINRLLRFDHPEELMLVFAGGIQDAVSATMVATLAAPLADRGARIGVLMGTAYLFTQEAVSTGAILSGYQQEARRCGGTVLLETAPGHATRCAPTNYAEAFQAERKRLEAEGLDGKEVWARLEQLNLGRLRMASKGLLREGHSIVQIDDEKQRAEGMFMIGDVATLREETTTIRDLHRDVSEGSIRDLMAIELAEVAKPDAEPLDIAIIGMACTFPQASDVDEYWYNIVQGVDSITEVPVDRWNPEIYYDPEGAPGHSTPSKWGGFIEPVPFDPMKYGIPPKSLIAIDAIQLLSLEMSQLALEDAGYGTREFDRESTAVIFGAEGGTDLSKAYGFRALYPQYVGDIPEVLQEHLPAPTEDSFPGVLTNVISGRIANRLDLGGENYTVNAACASSLASLSIAAQWLTSGSAEMVLVGGADVHNSIGDFLMFSSVHALSPTGRCRTFDHAADGITLGEGVGVIIVKRLADAVRDGDRVYAVLKGAGGSSDGKSLGLTAPRPEGQMRAYRRAYRMAGISPADVGMMEAHGTGTVVGDRTELETLDTLLSEAGADVGRCSLGSVKSQIGHTKAAAGVAAVIKGALALHNRVLPPTINIDRPNAYYDRETSPFTFSNRARPWVDDRRIAGISSFGFGGTNYHTVLEEYRGNDAPRSTLKVWPAELFLFRGVDRESALDRVERLEALLDVTPGWKLRDLARSTSTGGEGPVQIAVVAIDVNDLRDKLARTKRDDVDDPEIFVRSEKTEPGKIAFLFPGQGSQYTGMMEELWVAFSWLRDLLELKPDVTEKMLPAQAFTPEERAEFEQALKATQVAQVALGMCDLAMTRILDHLGISPDMMAGHSYGEMVALCHAGAWNEPDLLDLSQARAHAILEAAGDDAGAMVAANVGAERLEPLVADIDGVVLANHNAPNQTILSGPTPQIEKAIEKLEEAEIRATRLPVACAFHSGVVADAQPAFRQVLDDVPTGPLTREVWSNTTAGRYPSDPDEMRDLLAEQLAQPVLFAEQVEAMYEAGARTFVEVGPGRVLSGLVDRTLGDRPHVSVPTDVKGEPGIVRFLCALGKLAVIGINFDAEALFMDRGADRFDLEAPPERAYPPLSWLVDGHYARPVEGEIPDGALKPVMEPPVPASPPATAEIAPQAGTGDAAVLEYLRNIRELAEAQRQVMLSYIGRPLTELPAIPAAVPGIPAPAPMTPEELPAPVAAAMPAAPTGEAPAEPTVEQARPLTDVLLEIVSTRTGYPQEMLDLDLDLEADLSIDSIKRIEILGILNEEIGLAEELGDNRDELLEELASIKTLRGIEQWIEERIGSPPETEDASGAMAGAGEAGAEPSSDGTEAQAPAEEESVERFRVEVRSAPLSDRNGLDVEGKTFVLTDDGDGLAGALSDLLTERGADVRIVGPGEETGAFDGLVHLSPIATRSGPEDVKALFGLAQRATQDGAQWIFGVTGTGGTLGREGNGDPRVQGGVAGFLKSLAKECPNGTVRAIDLDTRESRAELAERLLAELMTEDERLEVGYVNGDRQGVEVVPAPFEEGTERPPLALDEASVILVTGGARGITARVSAELAKRFGCRLELVGRSPLPATEEPPETAEIEDPLDLKKKVIELHPGARPAEIEDRTTRILADREIRTSLASIEAAGGRARYHSVDVRDEAGFGDLIERLYEEHGRIDGVIHAAGLIEDKLLTHKTKESFDRVFDTKVAGALTLAAKLREDVQFVVFFSSVAGLFGNRGQTDYAAANDLLDKLAHQLNRTLSARVVSVNWGPWDSAGMVSPELRREYRRRGIGLIPLGEGVERLLQEITCGPPDDAQIVIMSATSALLF